MFFSTGLLVFLVTSQSVLTSPVFQDAVHELDHELHDRISRISTELNSLLNVVQQNEESPSNYIQALLDEAGELEKVSEDLEVIVVDGDEIDDDDDWVEIEDGSEEDYEEEPEEPEESETTSAAETSDNEIEVHTDDTGALMTEEQLPNLEEHQALKEVYAGKKGNTRGSVEAIKKKLKKFAHRTSSSRRRQQNRKTNNRKAARPMTRLVSMKGNNKTSQAKKHGTFNRRIRGNKRKIPNPANHLKKIVKKTQVRRVGTGKTKTLVTKLRQKDLSRLCSGYKQRKTQGSALRGLLPDGSTAGANNSTQKRIALIQTLKELTQSFQKLQSVIQKKQAGGTRPNPVTSNRGLQETSLDNNNAHEQTSLPPTVAMTDASSSPLGPLVKTALGLQGSAANALKNILPSRF